MMKSIFIIFTLISLCQISWGMVEFTLCGVEPHNQTFPDLTLTTLSPVFQTEVQAQIEKAYALKKRLLESKIEYEDNQANKDKFQTELEEMIAKKAVAGRAPNVAYEYGQTNFDLVSTGNPIKHGFVSTVAEAYSKHQPLELSPDDFWVLIAQGIAQYLGGNETVAEQHRSQFVDHEGKKQLLILISPGTLAGPGSPQNVNGWPVVMNLFGQAIKSNTKTNISDIIMNPFSTTGPVEQTVLSATLMETMKNYFEYKVAFLCGIPKIILHGSVEDYQSIIDRVDQLKLLFPDFHWYLNRVRAHMIKIKDSLTGEKDEVWWQKIVIKQFMGSGGQQFLTGWAGDFIPFTTARDGTQRKNGGNLDFSDLTYGVSLTDVILQDGGSGERWQVKIVSGFLGSRQNRDTGALRAAMGWMTYFDSTSEVQGQEIEE